MNATPVALTLSLDPDLLQRLQHGADANGTSINDFVVRLLEESVAFSPLCSQEEITGAAS